MFKKKNVVEPSTKTVTELVEVNPVVKGEPSKDYTAFSIVKIDGKYKFVTVKFNLEDTDSVLDYNDRDSANRAFKIEVGKSGILG